MKYFFIIKSSIIPSLGNVSVESNKSDSNSDSNILSINLKYTAS